MKSFVSFSVAIALVLCSISHARDSSAQATFSALETYVSSISNISFESETCDQDAKAISQEFKNCLSQQWRLILDEKRMWRSTRRVREPRANDKEQEDRYSESVVSPEFIRELTGDTETKTAISCTSYIDVPRNYWQRQSTLGYLAFPLGYLQHSEEYHSIVALLETDDRLGVIQETEDRVTLIGKLESATIRATLDTAKNHLPTRIQYSRKEDDLVVHTMDYRVTESREIARFQPQQVGRIRRRLVRTSATSTVTAQLISRTS